MTRAWAAFALVAGSMLACDGAGERTRGGSVGDAQAPPEDAGAECQWIPAPDEPATPVEVFEVRPQATDEGIDQLLNHAHLVHEPTADPGSPDVVLLLAGVGSGTNSATRLLDSISGAGFRAVSVAFVNQFSVDHYCERMPVEGEDCHGDVLREMLYGDTDGTRLLRIGRANSLLNRISKLLLHLRVTRGEDAWGDVVDPEGVVNWRRVVVVGGPQCGRLAAYLSRDIELARAVLVSRFGARLGSDGDEDHGALAGWHHTERGTPADRTYALWHGESPWAADAEAIARHYGLGVFGSVIDPDAGAPPYECSHLLATRLPPMETEEPALRLDESLVHDRFMALDADGRPRLTPAFLYALLASR